ncbi:MAG: FtsQ-type POTRA domain-containing protein [Bernardetiaceae bacterium]|nr:FtsQ-type POTRA domain-containing protein [Bernardetiaceae bacterium]
MKWNSLVKTIIAIILCLFAIGMAESRYGKKPLQEISVRIMSESLQDSAGFLTPEIIKAQIRQQKGTSIDSLKLRQIDLKAIERHLLTNGFVKKCQVSRDLSGKLHIEIQENRPIARILHEKGKYISAEGEFLPLSDRFTARVLLISGEGTVKMLKNSFWKSQEGQLMLSFLQCLEQDSFWRKQIAEVYIDGKLNITLYPQIGEQEIFIGKTENFAQKLENLSIFYRKIIPNKGWAAYKKVNLNFENQIICE